MKLDSITGNDKCAICLEGYSENHDVAVTNCSHLFHRACIDTWARKNGTCPFDRRLITNLTDYDHTKVEVELPDNIFKSFIFVTQERLKEFADELVDLDQELEQLKEIRQEIETLLTKYELKDDQFIEEMMRVLPQVVDNSEVDIENLRRTRQTCVELVESMMETEGNLLKEDQPPQNVAHMYRNIDKLRQVSGRLFKGPEKLSEVMSMMKTHAEELIHVLNI